MPVPGVSASLRFSFRVEKKARPAPRARAGTENTVDIVLATPNGPRPAIFVVSREPQGLKFDQSKEFASRYIPFGMDAMYGVTPAFWQTAVRVLPT